MRLPAGFRAIVVKMSKFCQKFVTIFRVLEGLELSEQQAGDGSALCRSRSSIAWQRRAARMAFIRLLPFPSTITSHGFESCRQLRFDVHIVAPLRFGGIGFVISRGSLSSSATASTKRYG